MTSQPISVIVPVFNEEQIVLSFLAQKSLAESSLVNEIIVIDGGSTDATCEQVEKSLNHRVKLIKSPEKGRGAQLAYAARFAKGEVLYFLHVDSVLPNEWDKAIVEAVKNVDAGCFRMKFTGSHPLLLFTGFLTRLPIKAARGGDQSLFITRTHYDKIGGYNPDYPIFEDVDIINKIYDKGRFTILPLTITTSNRRYEQIGTWRLQYHFLVLYYKKWRGRSTEELLSYYKKTC